MKNKILVVHNIQDFGYSYGRPFEKYGEVTEDMNTPFEELLFVVFTGGADVLPELYNEKTHHTTFSNPARDKRESAVYAKCIQNNVPMAGICRGAQFLNVMNGGKLIQHTTGHHSQHKATLSTGETIMLNSSHHQMCLLTPEADLLAWVSPPLSPFHETGNGRIKVDQEVECYFYSKTNCLGMQYHPEAMPETSAGFLLCQNLVEKFILKA